jgi:hypothetical protein
MAASAFRHAVQANLLLQLAGNGELQFAGRSQTGAVERQLVAGFQGGGFLHRSSFVKN